ncbi:MAG: hypothetical protein OSB76_19220, partial [Alphaproteobacteria bacterium]|nr:hypothetical protein [Alphaproteobacteria bacterium]
DHHHKQSEEDYSASLSETNDPYTGDQENSAPQPNFRFRREDEISPDPGGEQDRRPQCDASVILARRYAGFTSPARRQAQTQRR